MFQNMKSVLMLLKFNYKINVNTNIGMTGFQVKKHSVSKPNSRNSLICQNQLKYKYTNTTIFMKKNKHEFMNAKKAGVFGG